MFKPLVLEVYRYPPIVKTLQMSFSIISKSIYIYKKNYFCKSQLNLNFCMVLHCKKETCFFISKNVFENIIENRTSSDLPPTPKSISLSPGTSKDNTFPKFKKKNFKLSVPDRYFPKHFRVILL